MESGSFILGSSVTLSFQAAGAGGRVEVVDALSGDVLVSVAPNPQSVTLQEFSADLSAHAGKQVFLRIVDDSSTSWGRIAVDNITLKGEYETLWDFEGDNLTSETGSFGSAVKIYVNGDLQTGGTVITNTLPDNPDISTNEKIDFAIGARGSDDIAVTTVDDGAYALSGLADGTHHVRLTDLPGRLHTGPTGLFHEVVVEGGVVQGGNASYDFFTATNRTPDITDLSTTHVTEGEELILSATFLDSDSDANMHKAVITWADGTTSDAVVTEADGVGIVTASHTYTDGGFYDGTLTVIDGVDDTVFETLPFTAIMTGAGAHNGILQIVGTDEHDLVHVYDNGNGIVRVNASFLPNYTKLLTNELFQEIEISLFAENTSVAETAFHLDQTLDLFTTGDEYLNWLGHQEKWIRGNEHVLGNDWYFIEPDGSFYAWDDSGAGNHLLIATLNATYYNNTALLYNALPVLEDGTSAAEQAYVLDQGLGLYTTGNDFFDVFGLEEKWMRGLAHPLLNTWYFVTPTGTFFAADLSGAGNHLAITTLDATYYQNPARNYEATPPA